MRFVAFCVMSAVLRVECSLKGKSSCSSVSAVVLGSFEVGVVVVVVVVVVEEGNDDDDAAATDDDDEEEEEEEEEDDEDEGVGALLGFTRLMLAQPDQSFMISNSAWVKPCWCNQRRPCSVNERWREMSE